MGVPYYWPSLVNTVGKPLYPATNQAVSALWRNAVGLNILVACESSGLVRDALAARGHNVWSCDFKPTERPGQHWQGDVRNILFWQWDMLIAHPVCRRLTNAGVRWLHERPGYWQEMEEGAEFFNLFDRAVHIPKRCVENPIMHRYALERVGRRATQFVHPWWFGSPFQKATGLWLTGLEPLVKRFEKSDYPAGSIRQAVWLEPPGPNREANRSRTDPAVAQAMAEAWG